MDKLVAIAFSGDVGISGIHRRLQLYINESLKTSYVYY